MILKILVTENYLLIDAFPWQNPKYGVIKWTVSVDSTNLPIKFYFHILAPTHKIFS